MSRALRLYTKYNRKVHIYLGLFMLFFIWLFSLTGLFLNNGHWFHGSGGPERSTSETMLKVPQGYQGHDLAVQLAAQMKEQGYVGEILMRRQPPKPGFFHFGLLSADENTGIEVELATGKAKLNHAKRGVWAALTNLHTFTGVRAIYNEIGGSKRDWYLTKIWSFSIDAVSVALIILVLSSLWMWYQLRQKRVLGLISIALGLGCSAFFLWGLMLLVG